LLRITLRFSGAAKPPGSGKDLAGVGQSHPPLLGAGSVMGLGADGMKGEVFWGNLPCPHSKEKAREREGLFCQNFSIFSYR